MIEVGDDDVDAGPPQQPPEPSTALSSSAAYHDLASFDYGNDEYDDAVDGAMDGEESPLYSEEPGSVGGRSRKRRRAATATSSSSSSSPSSSSSSRQGTLRATSATAQLQGQQQDAHPMHLQLQPQIPRLNMKNVIGRLLTGFNTADTAKLREVITNSLSPNCEIAFTGTSKCRATHEKLVAYFAIASEVYPDGHFSPEGSVL
jgi:hypothetical protein